MSENKNFKEALEKLDADQQTKIKDLVKRMKDIKSMLTLLKILNYC